jgi:hypothetical protein
MSTSARKSLETDKKRKALEAQTPENWKSRHCSNPSTAPPPSIQARPALRAPGSTRAFNRARHLTRKQAKGKNASVTHALVQTEACLPKDAAGNFISEQERSDVVHDLLALLAEKSPSYLKTNFRNRWTNSGLLERRSSRQIDLLTKWSTSFTG